MRSSYFFHNPYPISRKYLQSKGESEIHVYGETPLTTMHRIAQEFEFKPSDFVIELGSGRGRSAFFLREYWGCHVLGIERIPFFANKALQIVHLAGCEHISFACMDMMEADFSSATIIYLYGSCLSDDEIASLIQKFEQLPAHVKIITVSYPLSDYSEKFKTVKQFTGSFPWGETEIFLNHKIF